MANLGNKGSRIVLTRDGVLKIEIFEVTFCDYEEFLTMTNALTGNNYGKGDDFLENNGIPIFNSDCNVAFTGSRKTARFFEANSFPVRRTSTSWQLPLQK